MFDTNVIHIDKNIIGYPINILEFALYDDTEEKLRFLQANIRVFAENYSPVIVLSPHSILLHHLKQQNKFLKDLQEQKDNLSILSYSLICIEKGFMCSSWIKKL